jgi:hypothetical protein
MAVRPNTSDKDSSESRTGRDLLIQMDNMTAKKELAGGRNVLLKGTEASVGAELQGQLGPAVKPLL